jgi:hypothetical protein
MSLTLLLRISSRWQLSRTLRFSKFLWISRQDFDVNPFGFDIRLKLLVRNTSHPPRHPFSLTRAQLTRNSPPRRLKRLTSFSGMESSLQATNASSGMVAHMDLLLGATCQTLWSRRARKVHSRLLLSGLLQNFEEITKLVWERSKNCCL